MQITSTFTYDLLGNVIHYKSPFEEWYYTYDAEGNIIRENNQRGDVFTYDYDGVGNMVCINCAEDATGEMEIYSYDEFGHVQSYTLGGISTTHEIDNNGNLKKISNSLGEESFYEYGIDGNLLRTTSNGVFGNVDFEACGPVSNGVVYEEDCKILENNQFVYTYVGDIMTKKLNKESSEEIKYEYTEDGRLLAVLYSDGEERFSFDEKGFRTGFVDKQGLGYTYLFPGDESSLVPNEAIDFVGADFNGNGRIEAHDLFSLLKVGKDALVSKASRLWVRT